MGKRKRMIKLDVATTQSGAQMQFRGDRPYWQTQPCPKWCSGSHEVGDGGSDRTHMGLWCREVQLGLYDAKHLRFDDERVYDVPADLTIYLRQGYREVEARVIAEPTHTRNDLSGLELTLQEAKRLAGALLAAVERAEDVR